MHLPWRIFHQNKHKWSQSGIKHASTFPMLKITGAKEYFAYGVYLWYKYARFSKTPLNNRTASLFWYLSWQRSSMWRREKTKLQQIWICQSNFLCNFPNFYYLCLLIWGDMLQLLPHCIQYGNEQRFLLVIAPILRNKLRDHFWHICQCFIYSSLLCHYFIYGIKYIKRL